MGDIIALMTLPFIACLVIGGLHSYLGLHVVKRGVIFVDLSLAQIATLGAAVAMAFGMDVHSPMTFVISLLFAIGGAVFFAVASTDEKRVPQSCGLRT